MRRNIAYVINSLVHVEIEPLDSNNIGCLKKKCPLKFDKTNGVCRLSKKN